MIARDRKLFGEKVASLLSGGFVLVCVASWVWLGSQSNKAIADELVPETYQSTAAELAARGGQAIKGIVKYRNYQFSVSQDEFDGLRSIVEASAEDPTDGLRDTIDVWLSVHLPPAREAWSGTIAFNGDQWRDAKQRMSDVDTTAQSMQQEASAVGATAAPEMNEFVQQRSGSIVTTIENRLTVFRRQAGSFVHPMMPLDISLAPWQDCIDEGASVAGQLIEGLTLGPLHVIRFTNTLGTEAPYVTDYTFRSDRGWAPQLVQSSDAGGVLQRTVYGYEPIDGMPAWRPAVVAQGETNGAGLISVTVWVVDEWDETCEPEALELVTPPLFLQVDYTSDEQNPMVSVVEPAYLVGIQLCDKVFAALAQVVQSLGTSEPDADFTSDGIVDADDIEFVIEKFGATSP